ncbi:alpha/beta fold hydrolase [Williamsia sp. M5A3_1d]
MRDRNTTTITDVFRAPPGRFVEVSGGAVAVRSVGAGPDILFVHGWPVSGATFRHLVSHLADRFRCHVIDLPGAGDSRFDRSTPLGIAEHADSVRTVVDALAPDDVAVVGHDSGGLIARHALAGDPRVRAWGLVATEQTGRPSMRLASFLALRHLPGVGRPLTAALTTPALRRSRLALGDCFADRGRLDGEFAEFFLDPLRDDPDRRWAVGELLRNFDVGAIAALPAIHRRIEVPVGLVYGDRDAFFPLERSREMVSTFGGPATLSVIPGGRLFVHEESAQQVAEALVPVLSGGGVS